MSARRMTEDELSAVAELERLCFAEPWSEGSLAILLREPNFAVVTANAEGRVCAYGGVVTAADEGEITNIATHPEHRRQGFARATVREMLAEARARGLCRLTLEVRESNKSARALYEAEGFSVCGKRRDLYRFPREDGLVMALTL